MSGKTIADLICKAKGARHGSFIFSGLEGIVAAITSISNINPTEGDVVYRGYDIRALNKTINVRRSRVSSALRKTSRPISKLPTIMASSWRISQRLEPIHPMRHLKHAENLLYMLSGYGPDEEAVNTLDRMLILYVEHEADVSSFTARIAASSFTDCHAALLAAIGSLKGRLHGGTSEQVLRMIRNINEVCKAEEWIKDALQKRQRIMGFGDRVCKQGDARAQIMKNLSRNLANKIGDASLHILCERIEEIVFREEGLHHNLHF
jgi:citrate synthase